MFEDDFLPENWELRSENFLHWSGRLLWTNGVSDRSSDADDVIGREAESGTARRVGIVQDVKETHFRTDEHVSPEVVADAAANINQEVMRAVVASAEVHAVARGLIAVGSRGLPPDSAE